MFIAGRPPAFAPAAPAPRSSPGLFSGIGHSIGHIGTAVQHATYTPPPARSANAGTDVQSGGGSYGGARVAAYKASPQYRAQVAGAFNSQPKAARTLALLQALNKVAPGTGGTQIPSAFLGSSPKQLLAQALLSQGNSKNAWNLSPADVAHFLKTATPTLLTNLPAFATGRPNSGKDINPLSKGGWTLGRKDMGLDASNTANGAPILAPNDSKVTGVDPAWFHGQPLVEFQLTAGPNKGKYWYAAEGITGFPTQVGATVKRGQPAAFFQNQGNGIEMGLGAGGTQTLAHATTGYTEGQVTPAADQFVNTFITHGAQPGAATSGKAVVAKPVAGAQAVAAMLGPKAKAAASAQLAQLKAQGKQPMGTAGAIGAPVGPARPIHSGAGLTVRGAPVTPSQIQTANTILGVAHQLGVSQDAATAAIYTAIYENSLTTGGPYNSSGYAGAFQANHSFNPNDTAGMARAFFLGDSARGFQSGGAVHLLKSGASIPEAAIRTEVPSIWPNNAYAGEAGHGPMSRALSEARAYVKAYGGFGGGNAAPIAGGVASSSGSSSGSSGAASSGSSSGSGVAPAASGGSSQAPSDPNAAANAAVLASLAGNTTQVSAQDAQRQSLLQNLLSSSGKSPWDFGPRVPGLGGSSNPFALLLAQSSLQSLAGGLPLKSPFKTSSKKSKG